SNQVLDYKFGLPTANHEFQPGHRVMVQVQSSLFPLDDRNPQTFGPNIYLAKPGDYQKATQQVWHAPGNATFSSLPVYGCRGRLPGHARVIGVALG
ncbi:CocE/NonD family hydrolase C-terminal non-catalytic domain-containing protein, partial [Stenotrophomonas sp. SrG]|uniref:CocE/NonD family hydrolase C-terminal non-catalytic domain-containing protein n=1 Tax=Stenotrophomonas sp. SrG TaxID=3414430 RepID=UPI003CF38DB3